MYRPLPKCLTIGPSKIDGLGIFAVEDIKEATNLGVSHVYNSGFSQEWIRTPLGGFYNHSEDPNCILKDSFRGEALVSTKVLVTIKDILKGEELTCTYTLYKLNIA